MFIFYTVNPEPALHPKAYILRVFKEQNAESSLIKTVCFPVRNPTFPQKTRNEATEFGRIFVKQLMDKEFGNDGQTN